MCIPATCCLPDGGSTAKRGREGGLSTLLSIPTHTHSLVLMSTTGIEEKVYGWMDKCVCERVGRCAEKEKNDEGDANVAVELPDSKS